jgi:ribosomal-protein-serine acetyltransferase
MRKTVPMGEVIRLPERIEGPRLLVRRWTPNDLNLLALTVERNAEHLRPWMPWIADEPLPSQERLTLLEHWQQEWREGGDAVLAIVLNDEVVGGSGLHRRRGPHGLEIGYWVDKDHLGQGIATEVVAMLTSAALLLTDISFVEIHHDKANVRSAMIPRRLGYQFLGETPDSPAAPAEVGIDCAWQATGDKWLAR